ncbi:MAG: iron uptake porin, partial [Xenococcaceae cyanobacterium]
MSKLLWQVFKATPVILVASLFVSYSSIGAPKPDNFANISQQMGDAAIPELADSTLAQALPNGTQTTQTTSEVLEQINRYNSESSRDPMAQITNVSQLRDISPTDWAYQALRELVERYNCIVGYPDRTFRGNRATSRYEFAAGLNACLNVIERLLQENVRILREDIEKLQRLAQEFEAELTALGARVDNLEGRVAFLKDHEFSTTTKLVGEVVFGLFGVAAGERDGGENIDKVTAFGDRVRIELNTSFTGKDLLFTR